MLPKLAIIDFYTHIHTATELNGEVVRGASFTI